MQLPLENIYHFPVKEDSVTFLRSQISKGIRFCSKPRVECSWRLLLREWLKAD